MRFAMTYDELDIILKDSKRNQLVLGVGGSGKTKMIKDLSNKRKDIILVAPSGRAAQNISGRTIQSFFGINYNSYNFKEGMPLRITNEKLDLINEAKILLIDEVSMVRCEVIDIVNKKLQLIRGNHLPFGGLRLVLFGDTCQLEPVITEEERRIIQRYYQNNNGQYYFFNSNCFQDLQLDIFELKKDFRHKDDPVFENILNEIRQGYCSDSNLAILNKRAIYCFEIMENYQYLTRTNQDSNKTNCRFTNLIIAKEHKSIPEIDIIFDSDITQKILKKQVNNTLISIKKGIHVMFIHNDSYENGNRWYNGSIGTIIEILTDNKSISLVKIKMNDTNEIVNVSKETTIISFPINSPDDDNPVQLATLIQFPFVPSYSMTIDKSQGLTIDKAYILLDIKRLRYNQLYVALSRVRKLDDLILSRKITRADIQLAPAMKQFNDSIKEKITPVYFIPAKQNIFNINNAKTVNIYNSNQIKMKSVS
jgi:hypothetical protein